MFAYQDLTTAAAGRAEPRCPISTLPGRAAAHPGDAGLPLRSRRRIRELRARGGLQRPAGRSALARVASDLGGGAVHGHAVPGRSAHRLRQDRHRISRLAGHHDPPGGDRRRCRSSAACSRLASTSRRSSRGPTTWVGFWNIDAILHTIEPAMHYTFITGRGGDTPAAVDRHRPSRRHEPDGVRRHEPDPGAHHRRRRHRGAGALGGGAPVARRPPTTSRRTSRATCCRPSSCSRWTASVCASDLAYSTHGQGLQNATNDVTVRFEPGDGVGRHPLQ